MLVSYRCAPTAQLPKFCESGVVIAFTVGAYLCAGVATFFLGPGRRYVSERVQTARGHPVANAITGREPVSERRLTAFGLTLSLVLILIWPIFLISKFQDRKRERRELANWEERVRSGIEFTMMGGAGSVQCQDCSYEEEIVSFTHGYSDTGPTSETGVQCLACGKFTTISEGGDNDDDGTAPCECGGTLSRDHELFCPKCRSKNLKYRMSYIT